LRPTEGARDVEAILLIGHASFQPLVAHCSSLSTPSGSEVLHSMVELESWNSSLLGDFRDTSSESHAEWMDDSSGALINNVKEKRP